jgi:hypothetical protein
VLFLLAVLFLLEEPVASGRIGQDASSASRSLFAGTLEHLEQLEHLEKSN